MPNLQLSNLVQQLRLSGISDSLEGRLIPIAIISAVL